MKVTVPHVKLYVDHNCHAHLKDGWKPVAVYDMGAPLHPANPTNITRAGQWSSNKSFIFLGARPVGVVTADIEIEIPTTYVFKPTELCGAARLNHIQQVA